MNTYETSATVEDQGHVHLTGVPFSPGTRVEVTINAKGQSAPASRGPDDGIVSGDTVLCWEGNVLVHRGVGGASSIAELRDEQLDRLASGQSQ